MKDDSNFWVEESGKSFPKRRKRKIRPKRLEYIGWGSKPLIEFLESLGEDTSKKLSQRDLTNIINKYVNDNKLFNPEKKKKIMCDQRLFDIFGKKSVFRKRIMDLLEPHFAENQDSSEDDSLYSSEEEGDKEKKTSNSECRPFCQKQKVVETPKSCFAAIIPENIKLVYLKRTLVQDLFKVRESFEDKVLGSFVRVKSDPHDYMQKNSHQLQQVLGVKMTSEAGDVGAEVDLQLSNYIKHVRVHMLSDDNFSVEECEDLRERIKAGLLKRPTVVELEEKAKMLHQDITKHWIPRETSLLQKLIDRANEKGWRRELYGYLERKQLLEKKAEQERLLSEIPTVTAEELEPEVTGDRLEKVEGNNSPAKLHHSETSDVRPNDCFGSQAACEISGQVEEIEWQHANLAQQGAGPAAVIGGQSTREILSPELQENKDSPSLPVREVKQGEVIELSDDETEVEVLKNQNQITRKHPEDAIWLYLDPQGEVQGPFSVTLLKRWSDANYFHPGFMVWKIGESQEKAVLLFDVLRHFFSL